MTANYQIIGNEEDMRKFYRLHLNIFGEYHNHAFMLFLVSRRKYYPELSTSQVLLDRKIYDLKKTENQFVNAIKKYEVAEGLYTDKDEQPIPYSGIAMYITANPLDELRALFDLQRVINTKLETLIFDKPTSFHVDSIYKSSLHSTDAKIFFKLDVDTKEDGKILQLKSVLHEHKIPIHLAIESKNGFHILLMIKQIPNAAHRPFHDFSVLNKHWFTIERNGLVVIPGTYQGGFLTRIVDWTQNVVVTDSSNGSMIQ